jgi:hypothetical protein
MQRRTYGWIALLAVALVSAATTVALAGGRPERAATTPPERVPHRVHKPRFPSAPEFARVFVGTTNQYAADHGDPRRISKPDCVQASPGHYMCSYVATRPREPRKCYLMQARWTPERTSTITVTLAGRTRGCGSLREALDSLP